MNDLNRYDEYLRYLTFSPLPYNGEVAKVTWSEVNDIKKIWVIRIVGTREYINFLKFQNISPSTVAVTRSQAFLEAGSLDLIWWPDLRWPRVKIFTIFRGKDVWTGIPKKKRWCVAPFLRYREKKLRGGGLFKHPPAGRGLNYHNEL